jgi:hypothetical protein
VSHAVSLGYRKSSEELKNEVAPSMTAVRQRVCILQINLFPRSFSLNVISDVKPREQSSSVCLCCSQEHVSSLTEVTARLSPSSHQEHLPCFGLISSLSFFFKHISRTVFLPHCQLDTRDAERAVSTRTASFYVALPSAPMLWHLGVSTLSRMLIDFTLLRLFNELLSTAA